jgi:hypothetical protein
VIREPVLVLEFSANGIIEWDSLIECARAHHVSTAFIKELIYTGGEDLCGSTYDIALHCTSDIIRRGSKLVIQHAQSAEHVEVHYRSVDHGAVRHGRLSLPLDGFL